MSTTDRRPRRKQPRFLDPARPRFLARPDSHEGVLVGLFITVYIPENACRKGDHGKLGDIRIDSTPEGDLVATFNWSAWGDRDLATVDAVAETFKATAIMMDAIVQRITAMDLVLETYGVRAWQAAGK